MKETDYNFKLINAIPLFNSLLVCSYWKCYFKDIFPKQRNYNGKEIWLFDDISTIGPGTKTFLFILQFKILVGMLASQNKVKKRVYMNKVYI